MFYSTSDSNFIIISNNFIENLMASTKNCFNVKEKIECIEEAKKYQDNTTDNPKWLGTKYLKQVI